jgi:hypothetical protein
MNVLRRKYTPQRRQWKRTFCQTGLSLLNMGLPSVERQRRRLLLLRPRLAVAPGDRLKFGSHLSGELGDFVV